MNAKYEGLPKYKLHLCPGCIKDLDEYYPYAMPREMLDIKEVSVADCDNTFCPVELSMSMTSVCCVATQNGKEF